MTDPLLEGLSKAVSVLHADMASLPQSRSCSITPLPVCPRWSHPAWPAGSGPGAAPWGLLLWHLLSPWQRVLATSDTSVLALLCLCPGSSLFCPGDEFQGESQDFVLIILAGCRVERCCQFTSSIMVCFLWKQWLASDAPHQLGADAVSQNTNLCVLGGGVTSSPARSLVLDNQMTHDGELILQLKRAGILSHRPSYTCIALLQLLAWRHSDSVCLMVQESQQRESQRCGCPWGTLGCENFGM